MRQALSMILSFGSFIGMFVLMWSDTAWEWWKHQFDGACDNPSFVPITMFLLFFNCCTVTCNWLDKPQRLKDQAR